MRETVSIVPSLGFMTALYAASVPVLSACARSVASISSAPASARENPRRICERMTPELPRAPRSEPSEAAAATSATVSPLHSLISLTAPCMVMNMFVPVSPSGTGKTLSESISALFLSSSAAPVRNISRSRAPPMVVFVNFDSLPACLRKKRAGSVLCCYARMAST